MRYCVLTPLGFQMQGSEAAVYETQEEAMKHTAPGDHIIPIHDTVEIKEYQEGRKRLPTFNRAGRR